MVCSPWRALTCLLSLAHAAWVATAEVTELTEWLRTLELPIVSYKDLGDGTEIFDVAASELSYPTFRVDHGGPRNIRLSIDDVGLSIVVGKVKNNDWDDGSVLGWVRWGTGTDHTVLRNLHVRVVGSFDVEVSVVLDQKLVNFSSCNSEGLIATITNADFETRGGLEKLDLTGGVKAAAEKVANHFLTEEIKRQVCGSDALTAWTQQQIDTLIAQAAPKKAEREPRTPSTSAVAWRETPLYQWFQSFSDRATENGFGWNRFLHPLFAGGSSNCLLGPRALDCLSPAPAEVGRALSLKLESAEGRSLQIRVDNLALHISHFEVAHSQIPKPTDNPEWLGFAIALGPVGLTLAGDLSFAADGYGPSATVEKRLAIDIAVEHFGVESEFLYEVDDFQYWELTEQQRANPICLDSIMTQFQLDYLKVGLRLQHLHFDIQPVGKSHEQPSEEVGFVRSLEAVVNALAVTAINNNPAKINELVQSIVRPGLESALNNGDSFSGFLQGLGVTFWGDECDRAIPQDGIMKRIVAGLLLASCLLGLLLKFFAPPRAADGSCLIAKQSTDLHWAVVVPLLIIACFVMLLMSNTMPAATMRIYVLLHHSEPTAVKDLITFSIVESARDLWTGGAKMLAALIFCFSLVFPYAKLVLFLCALLIPMPHKTRGYLTHVLDAVGKASLLDVFALMFMIVLAGFQVNFKGGIGMAAYIELEWGFQAFLFATVLNMVIAHLVLMLHHRAAVDPELGLEAIAEEEDRAPFKRTGTVEEGGSFGTWLCCSDQPIPIEEEEHMSSSPMRAAYIYILLLVVNTVVLSAGCCMTFTELEVHGLFGWFLNCLEDLKTRLGTEADAEHHHHTDFSTGSIFEFSLITLGNALGQKTTGATPVWTAIMQISYFSFAIGFVILFQVVGILQCMWILKKHVIGKKLGVTKGQVVALRLIGSTLFAWGAVDVFALGAIVTVIEMEGGSFLPTPPFMSKLIKGLRSTLDIPGVENELVALRPKLCLGAFLICGGALMYLIIGVQFIRFLDRLQWSVNIDKDHSLGQENAPLLLSTPRGPACADAAKSVQPP